MEGEGFLFFFIIFCSFNYQVQAECAKIESWELKIPDNTAVIGKNFGANWYEQVQWNESPTDDMVLSYDAQYWSTPLVGEEKWVHESGEELGLCDMTTKGEAGDIARIVRQLFGIPVGCNVSLGDRKTDPDYFGPSKPCREIGFDWTLKAKKQRLLMNLVYKDQQLLSGQIIIPGVRVDSYG